MFSNKRGVVLALALCAQLAWVATASAFEFWTNKDGTTSCFIYMDGGSDKGLFQDPQIIEGSGSTTFQFTPEAFRAESSNGGAQITSDRLEVHLWSVSPRMPITGINISETGDYGVINGGAVGVTGSMFVANDDRVEVKSDALVSNPTSMITSGMGTWTAHAGVNLANDELGPWNHMVLVFDNNLIATSVPGSADFIQKKVIDITITWVPEPASAGLLALGSLVMFARRRRAVA